jgi:membrane-associated phospholipid phosphatase
VPQAFPKGNGRATLEGVSVIAESGRSRGWSRLRLPPLPEPPATKRGRLLLAAQAGILLAMTLSVATRTWQDHLWVGFLLVGAAALLWAPEVRQRRVRRWWFVYVAGIFVYTLLRAYADETGVPVRIEYPIHFDRWLFLGTDPTLWLQREIFDPRRIGFVDYAAVATHWSFFIAPHALAVGVFLMDRRNFPRFALLMVGTMWLGLVLFFAVPTAPPWFAGELGALAGVRRIMDYVGGSIHGSAYSSLYAALGEPNSVAAMPSIHMAVTFAMYLWARRHIPALAPWLLGYSAVMALSLVYLGEHYVSDLLVGVACAFAAWLAASRFAPEIPEPAMQPADTGSRPRF